MAKQTDLTEHLIEVLEPLAQSHGVELWAVEQAGGRHTPVIRVLLDREGGLDIDSLVAANTWIGEALDEIDPLVSSYTLEVSSPGIDRPLRTMSHFERYIGETVRLKTRPEVQRRGTWNAIIQQVDGDVIVFESEGETVRVAHDDILKARLKGVVDFHERGNSCE